jgi:hypothetical protein
MGGWFGSFARVNCASPIVGDMVVFPDRSVVMVSNVAKTRVWVGVEDLHRLTAVYSIRNSKNPSWKHNIMR